MTDMAKTGKRPGIVTLIVIYLWVVAIASALVGAVLVIAQGQEDIVAETGRTSTELLIMGITELVIMLLVVWAAMALARGSETARAVVAAVMVIRIAATVVLVVWIHTQGYLIAGLLHVLLPFFVLYALYGNEKAHDWFEALEA